MRIVPVTDIHLFNFDVTSVVSAASLKGLVFHIFDCRTIDPMYINKHFPLSFLTCLEVDFIYCKKCLFEY